MRKITFSVLRILNDGQIHSGTALAQSLNCSRATISNALQEVALYGIDIAKIRGCGYRWINPIRWLDKLAVLNKLGNDSKFFSINLFDKVTSTNTYLLDSFNWLLTTNNHIQVVATELQTHGRGRRGSRWRSGLGDSLTFSLLWKFDKGSSALLGLSLVIGVAIIRALKQLDINSVALKWPNDVLYTDSKLAGTLIELRGEILGPTYAVIGIGLNFKFPTEFKLSIDQSVGDLYQVTGQDLDRNIIFATLLSELRNMLTTFSQYGFTYFRNEWVGYHAYEGKAVTLTLPDMSIIEGIVEHVNDDGSLNLITSTGRRSFSIGEISLRLSV